jgi:hypothetical protein
VLVAELQQTVKRFGRVNIALNNTGDGRIAGRVTEQTRRELRGYVLYQHAWCAVKHEARTAGGAATGEGSIVNVSLYKEEGLPHSGLIRAALITRE